MKKGKEFIFPENVDKDYGIWKDYTLKDFGYAALAGLVGLIFIAIPPYSLLHQGQSVNPELRQP